MKPLNELRESLPLPSGISVSESNPRNNNVIIPNDISSNGQRRPSHKKPEKTENNAQMDLIEFSNTECMDIGNLVVGKDIPPTSFTTAIGKKRYGVDVFIKERGREERICQLEKSLSQVLQEVGHLSADILEYKMKFEDQENKIQLIEESNGRLEKNVRSTGTLDSKVAHLETQVGNLCQEVAIDHDEIITHGEILERLMQSDEEEDETSNL
ncbi:uncharacterized protein MELLADRAFT_104905 [Melampsora larici-populina 98AG31]|uniref:Uncharacterized protein n=1 Tax=Melampsora larici-populina (strain 98AG31 / pathotype 3-4-7) TaxID=747676 RepID=F4RGG8_MELLP|nr:uncharacterized protein MELLADRAFT_104905 [Melampsora larici-populina 98AG31]EGG08652.1 hypothetical protein MELLADRAFT_104905 [Melampsora larici-populina 98AG31]